MVCIDGSEPGYIEAAVDAGRAPWFAKVLKSGTNLIADCVVPSLHQPQQPLDRHRPAAGGARHLRQLLPRSRHRQGSDDERSEVPAGRDDVPGVPATPAAASPSSPPRTSCAALLGKGLELAPGKACCFSSEKSDKASLAENGIENVNALVGMPVPDVYSAGLSEFVFAAGVKLMERDRPEIMYLSTTDYIQHKHAPGTPVANDFYAMMDGYMAKLDALGCTIVLTADHGMNAKLGADGEPDVIYLQDVFDGWLGKDKARVILPITDPYVVHHGALGSYAVVYLREAGASGRRSSRRCRASRRRSPRRRRRSASSCRPIASATSWSSRPSTRCSAPRRRGTTCRASTEPLRIHGGISEQHVPLICNRTLAAPADAPAWRNFDAFDLALNLVA